MTQTAAILEHLKAGRAIDPLMALSRYGCARLAARIGELRAVGYQIDTRMVSVRTRHGRARIAVYKMS